MWTIDTSRNRNLDKILAVPQLTHLSTGNTTYGNEQRLNIHLGPEEIMQVAPSVYMLRTRQPLSQELLLFSH